MKAIDKLIELRKTDSSIVAIAQDEDGELFYYKGYIPVIQRYHWTNFRIDYENLSENVEFNSNNWKECIVTVNDLESYEVKTITISESEYLRLWQAEKTLQNIQNIISKR